MTGQFTARVPDCDHLHIHGGLMSGRPLVLINLPEPAAGFGVTPEQAREIAETLRREADRAERMTKFRSN